MKHSLFGGILAASLSLSGGTAIAAIAPTDHAVQVQTRTASKETRQAFFYVRRCRIVQQAYFKPIYIDNILQGAIYYPEIYSCNLR